MRIHFLLFILFACYFQTQAQNNNKPTDKSTQPPTNEDPTFTYISEMPKFHGGGDDSLMVYIQKNLVYPLDARTKGIIGTVFVQYMIEKDGSVTNVKIVPGKELYPSLDQAAMEVIRNSTGGWTPGKNNGVPVAVKKIARIKFNLTKE